MANFRTESDSLGEKKIPEIVYYGINTARSLENFNFSDLTFPSDFIKAVCYIKIACAKANIYLGYLDNKKGEAILKACSEIISGKFSDQFKIDIFQAGSGTSTNMNVNEVIANRADELLGKDKGSRYVHPNDDVNKGQSTNDVFPSAIRIACVLKIPKLLKSLQDLEKTLKVKAVEFKEVIKSGRTHLQDAVPITLGQEFLAYSSAIKKDIERFGKLEKISLLPIGGNAIGTGLNTNPKFRNMVIGHLNKITTNKFLAAENGIEAVQFMTDFVELSSILRLITIDLNKIANDLRLMSSGPKTGFNEIILPAIGEGSSIMPGKINPFICEAVNMACFKVIGNDTTISLCAQSGELELNVKMPLLAYSLLESIELLINTVKTFDEKCINGIKANIETCRRNFENSPSLATVLNPYLGYDKSASLVKESLKTGKTIRQLALEKRLLTKEKLDKILDPKKLTGPNL